MNNTQESLYEEKEQTSKSFDLALKKIKLTKDYNDFDEIEDLNQGVLGLVELNSQQPRRLSIINLPLSLQVINNEVNISKLDSNKHRSKRPILTLQLDAIKTNQSQKNLFAFNALQNDEPSAPSQSSKKQSYLNNEIVFKRLCLATPPQLIRGIKY